MDPGELDDAIRALAHQERRALLAACLHEERRAGELADQSTLAMATVSEHLKVLRKTGLITVDRDGRYWLYRTNSPRLAAVVAELDELRERGEPLRRTGPQNQENPLRGGGSR